jgi:hypothetical protein
LDSLQLQQQQQHQQGVPQLTARRWLAQNSNQIHKRQQQLLFPQVEPQKEAQEEREQCQKGALGQATEEQQPRGEEEDAFQAVAHGPAAYFRKHRDGNGAAAVSFTTDDAICGTSFGKDTSRVTMGCSLAAAGPAVAVKQASVCATAGSHGKHAAAAGAGLLAARAGTGAEEEAAQVHITVQNKQMEHRPRAATGEGMAPAAAVADEKGIVSASQATTEEAQSTEGEEAGLAVPTGVVCLANTAVRDTQRDISIDNDFHKKSLSIAPTNNSSHVQNKQQHRQKGPKLQRNLSQCDDLMSRITAYFEENIPAVGATATADLDATKSTQSSTTAAAAAIGSSSSNHYNSSSSSSTWHHQAGPDICDPGESGLLLDEEVLHALQSSLALRFQQFNCPGSKLQLQQQQQQLLMNPQLPSEILGSCNMAATQGIRMPGLGRESVAVGSYYHYQQQQDSQQQEFGSCQGSTVLQSRRQSRGVLMADGVSSCGKDNQATAAAAAGSIQQQQQVRGSGGGVGGGGHSMLLTGHSAAAVGAAHGVSGNTSAGLTHAAAAAGAHPPTVRNYHEAWSSGFLGGGMHGHLSPEKLKFGHLPGSTTQVSFGWKKIQQSDLQCDDWSSCWKGNGSGEEGKSGKGAMHAGWVIFLW